MHQCGTQFHVVTTTTTAAAAGSRSRRKCRSTRCSRPFQHYGLPTWCECCESTTPTLFLSFRLTAPISFCVAITSSAHPPFRTVAVIREVTSELTIREVSARSPEASKRFSLLVLLSTPPADVNSDVPTGEAELVVDLGHNWLQQALGVDPDAFRALFLSRQPDDVAKLNTLVESVGWELENFGVAVFVLRQRETDGVVEVVKVERP
ncbi:hypothetical protein C4B63_11g69 [Trypanosoma cruzi]|uniref:Uncharacterized protein n=1 Tax=Trypanosoma cruzi TaxID=5693 RepID=A0A2V2VQN3_TRYCR|nr:hypothetical protein C4B63_11g69 [Trypanosoma cruzi]